MSSSAKRQLHFRTSHGGKTFRFSEAGGGADLVILEHLGLFKGCTAYEWFGIERAGLWGVEMELQVGLLEIRVNLGCLKGLSLIRSPVSCPQSRGLRPAVCPSKSFCCQIKNEFLVFQCMRVKERVREDWSAVQLRSAEYLKTFSHTLGVAVFPLFRHSPTERLTITIFQHALGFKSVHLTLCKDKTFCKLTTC